MRRMSPMLPVLAGAVLAMVLPCEALARAGGGGGGGGGGGIINIILLPILLIYSAIVSHLVYKKHKEARTALAAAAAADPFWDPARIRHRIEYVYFKVQEAWTERDQTIARDCMSDGLFIKHKLQTDRMIKDGTRNVLRSIQLSDATIVEIRDFRDNRRDQFWAYIKGCSDQFSAGVTGWVCSQIKARWRRQAGGLSRQRNAGMRADPAGPSIMNSNRKGDAHQARRLHAASCPGNQPGRHHVAHPANLVDIMPPVLN